MRIVILGAGQVGSSVAENLVSEANDLTVVDIDSSRLKRLQDRLDLRTVTGNAAHPAVLEQAGARDADMLLAVTQSDETNMVACKLAATMFNIPTKIARIRSADYLSHPEIFSPENFAVDHSICPEQVICDYIAKLLEFPESLQVLEFADGKVSLVAVRAFHGGPLVGHELQNLRRHLPQAETRVAAIYPPATAAVMPEGNTVIEAGDEVFFIAATENIRGVLRELRRMDKPVKRVMIGGGGNIGRRLARAIEKRYSVKIIEYNKAAAERLAADLDHTLVLAGDVTDEELLRSENIAEMDVYCAAHQRRREQHHVLAPRQAPGRAQGDRAHQPRLVREPPAERADRHRDLARAADDRHAARPRAPRRLRRRPFAAARRGRSARADRAWRPAIVAGGRPAHRGDRPAEGRQHRGDRAPPRPRRRRPRSSAPPTATTTRC